MGSFAPNIAPKTTIRIQLQMSNRQLTTAQTHCK